MANTPFLSPQAVRDFANLPLEVPDSLLLRHIASAQLVLAARLGVDVAGLAAFHAAKTEIFEEALTIGAYCSVLPHLNSFSLSGAAKIGRLEGTVEYRFLRPDEVDAMIQRLMDKYDGLVSQMTPDDESNADFGGMWMGAI